MKTFALFKVLTAVVLAVLMPEGATGIHLKPLFERSFLKSTTPTLPTVTAPEAAAQPGPKSAVSLPSITLRPLLRQLDRFFRFDDRSFLGRHGDYSESFLESFLVNAGFASVIALMVFRLWILKPLVQVDVNERVGSL